MSNINSIQQSQGYDATIYNNLLETAKTNDVSSTVVQEQLLTALQQGVDFKTAAKNVEKALPLLDNPAYQANMTVLKGGSLPSPMGIMMALMTDNAAEQREINRQSIQAKGEMAITAMENEAEEIRSNAVNQLIMGIVSGAIGIVGGMAQCGAAAGVGPAAKIPEANQSAYAMGLGQSISGLGNLVSTGAKYADSMSQATQKEFQADAERARMERENLKSFTDALSECISKYMSAFDAIQQGTNQTRTKIMS